ncbi:hypothetical protein ILUMI_15634 [Ignelater luminosus]|uniref:RNA-directed DNA polymerase n=1 Tax=Ignelater luminosus TaxID=2038154 RepID=A0A8K0CQ34_IGNLU|nr:hypothetical protein ILUMI_15634 [Ignelater luminosus]
MGHSQSVCRYKTYKCDLCSQKGHLRSMCPKNPKKNHYKSDIHMVTEEVQELSLYNVHQVSLNQVNPPIQLTVSVNRKEVLFDLDTGCAFTLLSEEVYEACFKEPLPIMGKAIVNVGYKGKNFSLPCIVIKSGGRKLPSLLGRDWIKSMQLFNSNSAGTITISNIVSAGAVDQDVVSLKKKFKSVFDLQKGKILGHEAKLAIKDAVEKELKRLVHNGVLKPVTSSEWASPVVVVPKPDGSIRIYADFKITINRFLSKEHYPLPNPKDIYASLAEGVVFTSFDLSEAYLQLPVHKQSQPLLTINTHVGLFQYQRLAFGVAPGPSKFQEVMDRILIGLDGTSCYLDNILIAGKSRADCLAKTLLVLERLQKHNIRVRVDKCDFFVPELKYLGHIIDKNGICPDEELLKALKFAPRPTNKTELKSYLGLINFYCHFVKNLSGKLVPLYELTKEGKQWEWSKECESIFKDSKTWICSSDVLALYDPTKKLRLTCDSSCYGVGAVLSHVINGEEKPISFASKTLSSAEKNYAQIEREALAIVFGLKKYHNYPFGRRFELITDHFPLTIIFGEKRNVPVTAAVRLQRWAILLSAYDYQMVYKKEADIPNADALSHLPLPDDTELELTSNCFSIQAPITAFLQNSEEMEKTITVKEVEQETEKDVVLKQVVAYVRDGWPSSFQNLQHIIDNYLMVYRNTPHTVTGRTPAEMFLGRRPRTRLSILQPNLEHVEKKRAATTPALIRVKTYDEGEKSLSTCLVRVNGFTRFVHVNYLKPRSTSELPQMGTNLNPAVNINPPSPQGSVVQPEDKTVSDVQSEPPPQSNMQATTSGVQPPPLHLTNSEPTQEPLRRSTRVID